MREKNKIVMEKKKQREKNKVVMEKKKQRKKQNNNHGTESFNPTLQKL